MCQHLKTKTTHTRPDLEFLLQTRQSGPSEPALTPGEAVQELPLSLLPVLSTSFRLSLACRTY